MPQPMPEPFADLSASQLHSLYALALELGPLRPPAETAALALRLCATLANSSAGALFWPGINPLTSGEADATCLPASAECDRLAQTCRLAGHPQLTPLRLGPNREGPALAVAIGNEPGGLLVLDRPAAGSEALLYAVAPLVAQALDRALYHPASHAELTRDQSVSLLVHDIRSPLVSAQASIEVSQRLLKGSDVPANVFSVLKTGLRSVQGAVELCNDLLEVKRLQAGYRLNRRALDLNCLLGDVADMIDASAAQLGARISVQVDPQGLAVSGDERLLRRLLNNLAVNALRFLPVDGQIELAAVSADGQVTLSVSDNGAGVPLADRERIFEPFIQGQGEASRGTGLGLFFCRQAAQAHGGTIWVEERRGGGSRFMIRLPAQESAGCQPETGV